MKTLTLILSIFFVCGVLTAKAQKPTYFIVEYPSNTVLGSMNGFIEKAIGSFNFGDPKNYETKEISKIKKGSQIIRTLKINIKDTTCVFFNDLWGKHEIIVIPGDTVRLKMVAIDLNRVHKDSGIKLPWGYKFLYRGKNKFIHALCDSIYNVYGALTGCNKNLIGRIQYEDKSEKGLSDYCNQVETVYNKRMDFLNSYCSRHMIPIKVRQLAESEIYYAYIDNLLDPMNVFQNRMKIEQYPESYRKALEGIRNNDVDMYFKTNLKSSVLYIYLILLKHNAYVDTPRHFLISMYNTIKSDYPESIRDNLQTINFDFYLRYNDTSCNSLDSLIREFKSTCKSPNYIRYIDALCQSKQKEVKIIHSYDEAIKSVITDKNNKKQTIANLLNKQSVVIDCWASWCTPCINEISMGRQFEKIYGNKVKFIYLSFDKDKNKWLGKVAALGLKDSYLLENNFQSVLAQFFNINTIPHYLIFDKDKKVLELTDLRPSNKENFELMLKYLAQESTN